MSKKLIIFPVGNLHTYQLHGLHTQDWPSTYPGSAHWLQGLLHHKFETCWGKTFMLIFLV